MFDIVANWSIAELYFGIDFVRLGSQIYRLGRFV